MIATTEGVAQRRVFDAVRETIQGIHPEATFAEDSSSSPFLFKSSDAKVWVRVFYQAMDDLTSDELRNELGKLKILMPKDARMYLFYPALDDAQISKFRSTGDRLAFFEYGRPKNEQAERTGVRIRKWISASDDSREKVTIRRPPAVKWEGALFWDFTRLSADEIGGLADLGLSLKRI